MRRLTERYAKLAEGDVLMVSRPYISSMTGKRGIWRFFLVVTSHGYFGARGYRLGDSQPDRRITVTWSDPDIEVYKLDEDEWPDGVWAFRTKLILEGAIDIT